MDRVSKEVRSKNMAAIRSRGNSTTELPLAKLLWTNGMRGYRKHWPVVGKPDFAWPGRRVAVFVDGCFWHGCHCKCVPRSNAKFWRDKIESNKRRDRRVAQSLRREGWQVIRVKECALREPSTLPRIVRTVAKALTNNRVDETIAPNPRHQAAQAPFDRFG
jgi:DNA mismatch endonuclease (patch repair protein)